MSNSQEQGKKRKRILKGIVVASSNAKKYSRIKVAEVAHYYSPINFKRVNVSSC